jgi:transposase-like protein
MSTKQVRAQYTQEFKLEAVRQVRAGIQRKNQYD